MRKLLLSLLAGIATVAFAYQPENEPDNVWSVFSKPVKGYSNAIGSYSNGCMTGAKALPIAGDGYIDMRRNRNRYYGQPELIQFIRDLGRYTKSHHQRKHLIGDLSQPRGGRMNFGHSSHQIGLDVDIWMQTLPVKQSVNPYRDMKSVVDKISGTIKGGYLPKTTRDALYYSATRPNVARIFVNPVVKLNLCQTETDTAWLNKLRPWWGHDEHFHVRLRCSANQPLCKNQKAPPPGDGCNASLENWVNEQSSAAIAALSAPPSLTKKKRRVKAVSQACQSLLN